MKWRRHAHAHFYSNNDERGKNGWTNKNNNNNNDDELKKIYMMCWRFDTIVLTPTQIIHVAF